MRPACSPALAARGLLVSLAMLGNRFDVAIIDADLPAAIGADGAEVAEALAPLVSAGFLRRRPSDGAVIVPALTRQRCRQSAA